MPKKTWSARSYHDEDIDLSALAGKTIAVLGFGSQGEAQALNMRDSGLRVIVGLKKGSASWAKAEDKGFEVLETGDAAQRADIIHVLIPDEMHGEVYEKDIKPRLKPGKTLSFSHGFSIVYGFIRPPKDVDVILISPKAPGKSVRDKFLGGNGVTGVFAVKQNYSGNAKGTALAIAKAIGLRRVEVSECTCEQETHVNLFAEQAVLCGGLSELIKAGFETIVDAGYPKKLAYVEVLKQTKLLADLIHEGGISHMWSEVSNTAEYGGRTRGPRVVGKEAREKMKAILREVQNGKFANEWIEEHRSGLKKLRKMRAIDQKERIEKVGREVISLFGKR